jgi:hypothetical protein
VTFPAGDRPAYRRAMTTQGEQQQPQPQPDAGHLDEDVEALEDPVHCGDAKHQHDLHEHVGHQDD